MLVAADRAFPAAVANVGRWLRSRGAFMKMGRGKLLLVSGGVLTAVLTMTVLLAPGDYGELRLPSPNGYDDFLSAADALRGEAVDYENELSLQALVLTNQAAYGLVRSGLTKRCLVPIRVDRGYPTAHTSDLARLKRLTHCMVARAELARRQGRTADAAEGYREAYALATRIGQGGLLVDFLVQISCRAIVLHHVRSLIPDLTLEQRSEMLRVIQQAEQDAEHWRTVSARQQRWLKAVFSPRERLAHLQSRVAMAIRDFSWRPLRSDASLLREAETEHRSRDLWPVMSMLRGRDQDAARVGQYPSLNHQARRRGTSQSRRVVEAHGGARPRRRHRSWLRWIVEGLLGGLVPAPLLLAVIACVSRAQWGSPFLSGRD